MFRTCVGNIFHKIILLYLNILITIFTIYIRQCLVPHLMRMYTQRNQLLGDTRVVIVIIWVLCHNTASFCTISYIYRSPVDIIPVAHNFLRILPLCTLLLCSMTYYDITMGNDVARDAHCNITMGKDIAIDILCDVTMSNDVFMCTSQCIITLLWTSFVTYYYTNLWYCYVTTKLFTIVYINH